MDAQAFKFLAWDGILCLGDCQMPHIRTHTHSYSYAQLYISLWEVCESIAKPICGCSGGRRMCSLIYFIFYLILFLTFGSYLAVIRDYSWL